MFGDQSGGRRRRSGAAGPPTPEQPPPPPQTCAVSTAVKRQLAFQLCTGCCGCTVFHDTYGPENLPRYCILSGEWVTSETYWEELGITGIIGTTSDDGVCALNVKPAGDFRATIKFKTAAVAPPYDGPRPQPYVIFNYEDAQNYYYILFQCLEYDHASGQLPYAKLGRVHDGVDRKIAHVNTVTGQESGTFDLCLESDRISLGTGLSGEYGSPSLWSTPDHIRLSNQLWVGVMNNDGATAIGVTRLRHIDSKCYHCGNRCGNTPGCEWGPDEWEVTISGVVNVSGEYGDINGVYICSREKLLNGEVVYNCRWNSQGAFGKLDDFGTWDGTFTIFVCWLGLCVGMTPGTTNICHAACWPSVDLPNPCTADEDLALHWPRDLHIPIGYDVNNATIHLRALT
jgi:hypothetical protein